MGEMGATRTELQAADGRLHGGRGVGSGKRREELNSRENGSVGKLNYGRRQTRAVYKYLKGYEKE